MYEVSNAAAYSPQAWTRSYPRPTSSTSPQRPLGNGQLPLPSRSDPAASSTPPPPPPPPQHRQRITPGKEGANRKYWNIVPALDPPREPRKSRSPDRYRNRREDGAAVSEPTAVEQILNQRRLDREAAREQDIPNSPSATQSRWAPVDDYDLPETPPLRLNKHRHQESQNSITPLARATVTTGSPSPRRYDDFRRSNIPSPGSPYSPDVTRQRSDFGSAGPRNVRFEDDPFYSESPRTRVSNTRPPVPPPGVGVMFKAFIPRDASGSYGKLPDNDGSHDEKVQWREHDEHLRQRRKRVLLIGLSVLILLAIIGGVVGGILGSKKSHSSSSATSSITSSSSIDSKGGLTATSSQVQAVMNNKNLHRVFPAMDYTGVNMQYPDCLTNPPSQDNATLDVAVMSQLTSSIRTYGTDCNQTEFVLTAIDRLELNSTMTVWLGVWLGNNDTTNQRQLNQMYDILDRYPVSRFKGVIVGNEVLFRKDMSIEELRTHLTDVRQNLTSKNINLTVSTSDLGSNWGTELDQYSDIQMANVHPFLSGNPANVSAAWTYDYWQSNDVALLASGNTKSSDGTPRAVIAETGWPSTGGNDCGSDEVCGTTTGGSVAGIDEMNTFMDGWVCGALKNGTEYFWFEAFDEPWKASLDSGSDNWEDHWGLFTVDRELKDGLVIPDCGGQTIDS